MTRKKMIAGNWKMNKTTREAIELANGIKRELSQIDDISLVVCVPFTALDEVSEVLYESNIALGAQNMHWEESGAFTGEISGAMLKDLNCSFVILGHSERRQLFHETDENVNLKTKAALKYGLAPIVCVGETLEEREKNITFQVIEKQINGSLKGLSAGDIAKVVIAYEPVWAIGTGKTASPQQAQEVHAFIRGEIKKKYSESEANNITILYGGSVKPSNTKELMKEKDIDGGLIGGASLDVESFREIVNNARS